MAFCFTLKTFEHKTQNRESSTLVFAPVLQNLNQTTLMDFDCSGAMSFGKSRIEGAEVERDCGNQKRLVED